MEGFFQLVINPVVLDATANWDQFLSIYNRLCDSGNLETLYWESEGNFPFPRFLDMYKPGTNNYIIKLNAFHSDLNHEFMGFVTINGFTSYHKCFAGIWLEPKWRGRNSYHIGRQALAFVHGTLKIKNVFAITPWHAAKEFLLKVGMKPIGEIPGYYHKENDRSFAEIFHSEKEIYRYRFTQDLMAFFKEKEANELVAKLFPEDT